jgi:HEAT repeat protein
MTGNQHPTDDLFLSRVTHALSELGKGMKSAAFYPAGHPSLIQTVAKIILLFEEIPLPEEGITITVTRNALLYGEIPLPVGMKSLADLNRELYLRRASRVIFLPDLPPDEVVAFLKVLTRDVEKIQDAGGLESVLLQERITRIWVNRVDYAALTELLKKEEEFEEVAPEDLLEASPGLTGEGPLEEELAAEPVTIDALLARIEGETDPAAYRGHLVEFSRFLLSEPPDRKVGYASLAMGIFIRHIERPPGGSAEIAGLARLGIKELSSEELIAHYISLLKRRGSRKEVETVLVALEDRSVGPLLQTLAEEEDLLVRKTILEIVTRIGRPAVPAILENLGDPRWYMVRNMINVLGNLGMPDLAPHVAATLSHPDLRVKKEAIKALSRTPHPSALTALCELCFFPEETVALTATAALALKRETDAVVALYRRATLKRFLYPNYRLANEAIDSLRAIGTDEALTALEEILALRAAWPTEKFRAMKTHALRCISRMKGDRSRGVLDKALRSPEKYIRIEAQRIINRLEL